MRKFIKNLSNINASTDDIFQVYFDLDGHRQIEFEGTEAECNDYIAHIEPEQQAEYGDEHPERFIQRKPENTAPQSIKNLTQKDIKYIERNVEDLVHQLYENNGYVAEDELKDHIESVVLDPEYADDHEASEALQNAIAYSYDDLLSFALSHGQEYANKYYDGYVASATDITSSTGIKLYKQAESIASNIEDLLNNLSNISDLNDYLDEDDLDHIGKAMDALYDFAQMYSNVEGSTDITASNPVTTEVPAVIDSFLQDIAQFTQAISYNDIITFGKNATDESIKQLKRLRNWFLLDDGYYLSVVDDPAVADDDQDAEIAEKKLRELVQLVKGK